MKKPIPITHITINTARASPDDPEHRSYCAGCRLQWKCPNPDKPVMAKVLQNCEAFSQN